MLKKRRDLTGATPGTFEAWLALRGLRTLHVRLERAQANAQELVRRLAEHPAIGEVRYPGFGAIVSVVLAQGAVAADLLTRKTTLWVHATSLGGVESTFERRRRWKTEPATIPDGLVRMSVGIEDVDDLWSDLAGPSTTSPASSPASDTRRDPEAVTPQRRSVALVLGLLGDQLGEHVGGGHLALDDGVHGLDDRRVDVGLRARSSSDEQDLTPSATCRVEPVISSVVMPWPSFSPKVRLRESGDEQDATRSPRPGQAHEGHRVGTELRRPAWRSRRGRG